MTRPLLAGLSLLALALPVSHSAPRAARLAPRGFADDVAFLRQHTTLIVLGGAGGAQVAVAPEYQGRVMTSTADGTASFGWIGRDAVARLALGRPPGVDLTAYAVTRFRHPR